MSPSETWLVQQLTTIYFSGAAFTISRRDIVVQVSAMLIGK